MTDLRALLAPIRDRFTTACDYPGPVTIEESQRDVDGLLSAIEAVADWCDTNQHPFHPAEGAEGFSSQDWALDDAARRIRTALAAALGSDTTNQEGTQ